MNPVSVFEEIVLNESEQEITFLANCPPLGKIRLVLDSTAFQADLELRETSADGSGVIAVTTTIDQAAAATSINVLKELEPHWHSIWPKLYDALVGIRTEYGKDGPFVANNTEITISPPGDYIDYEQEDWECSMGRTPFDGNFGVEFNLSGEILDTMASF